MLGIYAISRLDGPSCAAPAGLHGLTTAWPEHARLGPYAVGPVVLV